MKTFFSNKSRSGLLGLALLSSAAFVGCEDKGPMEKAGEKVDNAAKSLDPRGPMEKAGAKVDNAVNK